MSENTQDNENLWRKRAKKGSRNHPSRREIPTIKELRQLLSLIEKDFEDFVDMGSEFVSDFFASNDLLMLSASIYLQIWLFHFEKTKKYIDEKIQNDLNDWNYIIELLRILADIASDKSFADEYIFVETKYFRDYVWSKKLNRIVRKIKKTTLKERYRLLQKVSDYAHELYSQYKKIIDTPSERLVEQLQLKGKKELRWQVALLMGFEITMRDRNLEDVLKEKLFFLKSHALALKDYKLVEIIDEELEVLEKFNFEFVEEKLNETIESLPPKHRELLEDLFEAAHDIRDKELDLQYVKEHPQSFFQLFSIQIVGINNAVTVFHSFYPMPLTTESQLLEEYTIDESYFELSWMELKELFNFKNKKYLKEKIEQCSERRLANVVQEVAISLMTFVLGKIQEYNTEEVFIVIPEKIDVDFKRLNIKEKSGLSKNWREKFARFLRQEIITRANNAGIPVVKVDTSLEEQYGE